MSGRIGSRCVSSPQSAVERRHADSQPLRGGRPVSVGLPEGQPDRLVLDPLGGALENLGEGPREIEYVSQ